MMSFLFLLILVDNYYYRGKGSFVKVGALDRVMSEYWQEGNRVSQAKGLTFRGRSGYSAP
jgi:hypothetical protein